MANYQKQYLNNTNKVYILLVNHWLADNDLQFNIILVKKNGVSSRFFIYDYFTV